MNFPYPVLRKLGDEEFESLMILPFQLLRCDPNEIPTCCLIYIMAMTSQETEGCRFLSTSARVFRMSGGCIDHFLFGTKEPPNWIAIVYSRTKDFVIGHRVVLYDKYENWELRG